MPLLCLLLPPQLRGADDHQATYQQLQELAQALHVNQSAIVAQALARWHRVEPLVKDLQKQVAHGNSDSGV